MLKKIIKQYPKLTNYLILTLVITIGGILFYKIISLNIIASDNGEEKYSILDKLIHKVRCNDERNIRLRELKPNAKYYRKPPHQYPTLENKEYLMQTDSNGFIAPALINKNPDLQIFFLGGSTTECEMVDEKYRFPYLVGRILEDRLKIKVNSDNGAKSGNNSLHSINILLNKIIPLNPDIVVMMHNINDLSTLFYEGTYWNKNKVIAPIACDLKNKSKYIKQDQWSINKDWQKLVLNDPQQSEKMIKDFKQNLKIFVNIAKAKKITPVLMTQANRIESDPDFTNERGKEASKLYQQQYIKFNQSIRDVAKQENVLMIDLAKLIPADEKYIYDVVHFNQAGSELVANEISKSLIDFINNKKATKKNKSK